MSDFSSQPRGLAGVLNEQSALLLMPALILTFRPFGPEGSGKFTGTIREAP